MPFSRGERLRRLREQRGIEQREASAAIGISQPYLSLLERDRKGRHVNHMRSTLERAAAFYGVIPEYLLSQAPQEYIASFVRQLAPAEVGDTFGSRLAAVLQELRLRWGDEEFGLAWLAASLGTTPTGLEAYLRNEVPVTDTVAQHLSTITGAPLSWLVPEQAPPADPSAPFQQAFKLAMESGMEPGELQTLIRVWLAAQPKRPSG